MSPSPMQQQASGIIKATAKLQDTEEPIRQRPVMEFAAENKPQVLPNTIRASIDSGRDNPFRPDGKIYKSADPIVDTYKFGFNQSRTQSPTDSQLLLKGYADDIIESQSQTKDGISKKTRSRYDNSKIGSNEIKMDTDNRRPSCWRRWLCCCCYCSSSSSERQKTAEMTESDPKKGEQKKGCRWCCC